LKESTSWYPSLNIDGDGSQVVSQAGAVALLRTAARPDTGHWTPDHVIIAEDPLAIDLDSTCSTRIPKKIVPQRHTRRDVASICCWRSVITARTAPANRSPPCSDPAMPARTATDHKTVLAEALRQLLWEPGYRVGRKVLVRTDAGGGTHEFL
jgi:hypothetical protein